MPNRLPSVKALALALPIVLAACGGPGPSQVAPSSAPTGVTPTGVTPTSAGTPSPTNAFSPTPRTSATMAWDARSQTVLLFGGDASSGATNFLDAWDGTAWAKRSTLGPPSRDDGLLVADPDRGVVVLAGGRNGQTILTDTWEWDGTTWAKQDVDGPTPRAHAAAAYDHASKRMIVYGGVNDSGTLHDTWAWDGKTWTQIEDKGIPGLVPNYMAWDSILQRLLVLAVDLNAQSTDQTYPSELWGFTGTGWELVAKDGPRFSPLQQFVEGPRHPWLIDGGVVTGKFAAYEWSGTDWTFLAGTTPPVRNGQAVAFDPVRHQMVLFGGFVDQTVYGDTWVMDDGAWREVGP